MLNIEEIMSRYRRNKAVILKSEGEEEKMMSRPKRHLSRLMLIVVGIAVSLATLFVLLGQLETPYVNLFERYNYDWHRERRSWKVEKLDSRNIKTISNAVDIERLMMNLSPILIPRTPGSEGIQSVAHHILSKLQRLGWSLQTDRFDEYAPGSYGLTTFTNLIATKHPAATRRLVLACHYDSKVTPLGFLGAIDSAVPCAMMIEIAHALQDWFDLVSATPEVTLQLIFLDGEEAFVDWTSTDSIYGARHLADLWQRKYYKGRSEIEAIDLFILLDLIGTSETIFRNYHITPTRWYKFVSDLEKKMNRLGLINDPVQRFPTKVDYHQIEDDHIPFKRAGVPIMHLIPAPFPKVWHTMEDNINAVDRNTVEYITKILTVFVAEYLHLSAST